MNVKAYAKLNIYLDILGKRPDGYHEIETVMCAIDLADDVSVEISQGDGIFITCDTPGIPLGERNTAHKAARLFSEAHGVKRRIDIGIVKRIPVMAGLGGSSADAAAVLNALNALFGKPFSLAELLALGAEAGADVPFCIHGGFMRGTGTGTTLEEVTPDSALRDCAFVIVKPESGCSTREAYALWEAEQPPRVQWRGSIGHTYNVFEKLYNNAETARLKAELLRLGASGAALTGSGSAVFGVFGDLREAQNALSGLNERVKFTARPLLDKQY
jgi:4-diphosphocytidyl-2-C-methyl-D-erythritol kinase